MNNSLEHYDPEFQGRNIAAKRALSSTKQFIGEELTDPLNYIGGGMFGAAKTGVKLAGKALVGAGLMRQDKDAEAMLFGLNKVPEDVMEKVFEAMTKGKTPKEIFKETGVDVINKRYYVPDTGAKWVNDAFRLTTKAEPLTRYVGHDAAFEVMPGLRRIRILVDPNLGDKTRGGYYAAEDLIVVNPNLLGKPKELLKTVIHEIQHSAQTKQKLPNGSSPEKMFNLMLDKKGLQEDQLDEATHKAMKKVAFQLYRQNPGEKEARFAQKLSDIDLRKVPDNQYQSIDDLMNAETMYRQQDINPFYNPLLK